MGKLAALVLIVLAQTAAPAAPPQKLYYLGEIKLSSPTGQPMGSQVIILEKIMDPDKSSIIERALVVKQDGKAEEWTMRMTVKDDNTFTLMDDKKSVEGTGTMFGPAWKWTYFKGTFKASNGVVIEDENFLADDSVGSARKKLITPDNKVFMYMDMSLKGITPNTFEILRAGLMKK